MSVKFRQAITNFQRYFTDGEGIAPLTDGVALVPVVTVPMGISVVQVEPGVFESAVLGIGVSPVFSWPEVPRDESHVYENVTLSRLAGTNAKRVALNVTGRQSGTSWSRAISLIDTISTIDRWNMLGSRNAVNARQYQSPGPLRLYPGDQLVVHLLSSADAGDQWRVDYVLRREPAPFTYNLNNLVVVTT